MLLLRLESVLIIEVSLFQSERFHCITVIPGIIISCPLPPQPRWECPIASPLPRELSPPSALEEIKPPPSRGMGRSGSLR